jgi:hypothetical protein
MKKLNTGIWFGTIRVAPRKPSTARVPERLREIARWSPGTRP